MSDTRVTFTIAADPPPRLDKAIARDVPEAAHLSRSRLARLIEAGQVTLNGRVAGLRDRVIAGDAVAVFVPEAVEADIAAQDIPLKIVHEDDDLLIVDKPAGMVVHPAPGTPDGTLVNALLHHLGDDLSGVGGTRRPGIVHRIDKDTSGLLVVAKTDVAHHGLAAQFEAHGVRRLYQAICHGCPDPADPRLRGLRGVSWEDGWLRIETRLDRHRTDRQRQAVVAAGGRHAISRFRMAEPLGAAALLDCRLETGRTHQIRVHATYLGHGLIGDPVYGGRRRLPKGQPGADIAATFPRQALHAATLGFRHPVLQTEMQFQSPLPPDMERLLTGLR